MSHPVYPLDIASEFSMFKNLPNFLVGHKAFGAKKYSPFFKRGWNMLRLDQPQPVHGGTKVKQKVYKEHCIPLKFSCFNTYKQAGLLKVFLEHLKTLSTFAILFWTFWRLTGNGQRYLWGSYTTAQSDSCLKMAENLKCVALWILKRLYAQNWISSSFFPYFFF